MKVTTWQDDLKSIIHSSEELFHYLELDPGPLSSIPLTSFPLRVPKSFASRMEKGNPDDPLLRQVLPSFEELKDSPSDFSLDPLQEKQFVYSPGVLQKFQGRVLIVSTGYCPVHCRYCFRRHFDYTQNQISLKDWEITLETLKNDTSISEVIFSGGDPLTLPDKKLESLFHDLMQITHLETIRLHTRFPIVIPSRLTDTLKSLLKGSPSSRVRIVIVLHINHAQEIDDELMQILRCWNQEGVFFLNQSVLLKGVNDSLSAQINLWKRCFSAGIVAYYLHQCDAVLGAEHFFVPIKTGQIIVKALRNALPGYMVPLYVQEIPFSGSKVPLESYSESFQASE